MQVINEVFPTDPNIETVLQQGFDSPLAAMMKGIAKGAR